uniref:DDE-1 domain-containing protein n=1 Tax=Anopheles dirus TaxID=7168 RepID=A0A182NV04_9DIPT
MKKKMAGTDWLNNFLDTNPNLLFHKPDATSAARVRGFKKPTVNYFFDLFQRILETKNFSPSRIYNADEVPNKKSKIAAMKGNKQVGAISSAEREETTTAVMFMSATGHFIPPFLILPRARMNDSLKNGTPSGAEFACNPSGYMTVDILCAWFDHFLLNVHPKTDNPVLLVVDGHSSHTKNLSNITEKARVNHATIIVLPPHCSNMLQPLNSNHSLRSRSIYEHCIHEGCHNTDSGKWFQEDWIVAL